MPAEKTEKKIDLRAGATHLQQNPPRETVESAGVEVLIGRLRDQGIAQGKSQAEGLVAEAQRQAADIVTAAKHEADEIRVKANQDAEKLKAAGEEAIRQAMRDTILSMESELLAHFQNILRRLVTGVLEDEGFLERLILEVAGKAAPSAKEAQVLLPGELVSFEDLQRKPEEARAGTLTHFVLALGGRMLREGVGFGVAEDGKPGISVKLVGEDMQLDLTEGAISQLLLRHMLPRFRAVLHGAVVRERGTERAASPEIRPPAS